MMVLRMSNAFHVITGGTHAGKTTLVEFLESLGVHVIREAAIDIITALVNDIGLDAFKAWRQENALELQISIAKLQANRELQAINNGRGDIICDRGVIDAVAYCRLTGVDPSVELLRLAEESAERYETAFLLETLPNFDPRESIGRACTQDDSFRAADIIENEYARFGVKVKRIGAIDLKFRADALLAHIKPHKKISFPKAV